MAAIDANNRCIFIAGMRHGPVQIAHRHAESPAFDGVNRLRYSESSHERSMTCGALSQEAEYPPRRGAALLIHKDNSAAAGLHGERDAAEIGQR